VPFLTALVLSFLPGLFYAWVVYRMDRYEKEPKKLLAGVFLWGALMATVGAIVVQVPLEAGVAAATGSAELADAVGTSLFAPISEEVLKGLAVLGVFLFFRHEFDSLLDGIVYGAVVGLGFAATENVLYLLGAYHENGMEGLYGLFVLRVLLGGWNHAIYTALTGIGLALARMSPRLLVRLLAPPLGLVAAIGLHSFHNSLALVLTAMEAGGGGLFVVLLTDWLSWIAMAVVILFAILHEGRLLQNHLAAEVHAGILRAEQLAEVRSLFRRQLGRLRELVRGRYREHARFQQACAELAHKKHQRARRGTEPVLERTIAELRQEVGALAARA
jgi:protease PrsW